MASYFRLLCNSVSFISCIELRDWPRYLYKYFGVVLIKYLETHERNMVDDKVMCLLKRMYHVFTGFSSVYVNIAYIFVFYDFYDIIQHKR
jgi:hypothetical protein